MPDPVIYRSEVATTWDKYHNRVVAAVWGEEATAKNGEAAAMATLLEAGTDPLAITVEQCRKQGGLIARQKHQDYAPPPHDVYSDSATLEDKFPDNLWNSWIKRQGVGNTR